MDTTGTDIVLDTPQHAWVFVAKRTEDGGIYHRPLTWMATSEPKVQLALRSPTGDTLRATGRSLFDALVDLRNALEGRNHLLLIKGARRDVWPVGDFARAFPGLCGYKLRGSSPTEWEKVDLLDPEQDPEAIGSLLEQINHMNAILRRRQRDANSAGNSN